MIIRFEGVSKSYSTQETALQQIEFDVSQGEFTALSGPSGSGKTTILNLAAGLDGPTSGTVNLLGHDLSTLGPKGLSALRRKHVGFVFQSYNLFPVLTAVENVEFPLALQGISRYEREARALKALEETGCGGLGKRRPSELSGGQQQRVAIARAIVSEPKIVFADEPTANLDSATATKLLELFQRLNESHKITFLFSSHDPLVLNTARRILKVKDGRIQSDSLSEGKPRTKSNDSSTLPQLRLAG